MTFFDEDSIPSEIDDSEKLSVPEASLGMLTNKNILISNKGSVKIDDQKNFGQKNIWKMHPETEKRNKFFFSFLNHLNSSKIKESCDFSQDSFLKEGSKKWIFNSPKVENSLKLLKEVNYKTGRTQKQCNYYDVTFHKNGSVGFNGEASKQCFDADFSIMDVEVMH